MIIYKKILFSGKGGTAGIRKPVYTEKHMNNELVLKLENSNPDAARTVAVKRSCTSLVLHRHDYFEVELILSGKVKHTLNGRDYILKCGDFCVLTPSDFHEIGVLETSQIYNVSFDTSAVPAEFAMRIFESDDRVFSPHDEDFDTLCLLAELLCVHNAPNNISDEKYSALLLEAFTNRLGRLIYPSQNTRDYGTESEIQKSVVYLHTHFRDNPTLAELASICHLSPGYFSSLFKSITGKNVSEYLTELRIDYAKRLLIATNLSVTDICFSCGYGSVSNFMKAFKCCAGISPLCFRKSKKSISSAEKQL